MVVAGMLAAGLLLSAWLGLLGAAILALTGLGVMEIGSALLLTVPVNLVVALILWRVIGRLSHDLRFPSNARSLEPPSSQCQETETS
jgi:membrane protein implicated in regulation of membrane protease activity